MKRALAHGVCALALGLTAVPVRAHAPLPRAVAVSPDGAAVALALPGFGLLLRSPGAPRFAYACDAALGIPPSDSPVALQPFADAAWLLGSPAGLRVLDADGCESAPRHATLGSAPVSALAIDPASQVAYAIGAGQAEGVWRSADRARSWERRGGLELPEAVSALLIDPRDPNRLYLSRGSADADATLLESSDGGASFVAHPQTRALRLLAVQSRLWAVARALDARGNRGFEILRADVAAGPWQSVLRVNYFGGLTITGDGAIWVGDEGGGVYRSSDGGDSFLPVEAPRSVSCLASAGSEVWACTPDLPAAPALNVLDLATTRFQPSIALADVDEQLACGRAPEAPDPCLAAWVEWQRDVIGRDLSSDAGMPADDAGQLSPDAAAAEPPPPTPADAASCAVIRPGSDRWMAACWLAIVTLAWATRRRFSRRAY